MPRSIYGQLSQANVGANVTKLLEEMFGTGKDDISKQNALTRYSSAVNLYAGKIGTNWDSGNLAERQADITAFHNKIKKDPNYDPIIGDHIDVVQRQIDDRVRINNKFNLDIDAMTNVDSQLINIADEYIAATKEKKSPEELNIIVDRVKKIINDRSRTSRNLQTLDPTRWQASSELQFLDRDIKTNSGYLMRAIKNDGIIDPHEYGIIMNSIDTDDPTIIDREDALTLNANNQRNTGLIKSVQELGVDANTAYTQWQDAISNGVKGSVLQDMDDDFIKSLEDLETGKMRIGKYMGARVQDEIWESMFPEGYAPWEDYEDVTVKTATEKILKGKMEITDLPKKYFGADAKDGISAKDWGIEEYVPIGVGTAWFAEKAWKATEKARGYISAGLKMTEETKIAGFLQAPETRKASDEIFKLKEKLNKLPEGSTKRLHFQKRIDKLANIFSEKHGYKIDASKADIIKLMKNSDKWNIWQFKSKMLPLMRQAGYTLGDVAKPLAKLGKGAWWTLIPFEGGMKLAEKMGIEGPVGQISTGVAATKLTSVARKSITKKIREKGIGTIKDKLKDPRVASKVGQILIKKAPWVAAKMGIGAVGTVVPEPVSSALGLGLLAWATKDIYSLIVNDVPELYYILFPEEKEKE